jgi:ATP-dependent Clp protease adapter protein ClpS
MSNAPKNTLDSKTSRNSSSTEGNACKVVLFNCNCHTFESVITQLMYAIGCSYESANRFAHIIHLNGKATVCTGERDLCEDVADKLAEIGLIVRVTS